MHCAYCGLVCFAILAGGGFCLLLFGLWDCFAWVIWVWWLVLCVCDLFWIACDLRLVSKIIAVLCFGNTL